MENQILGCVCLMALSAAVFGGENSNKRVNGELFVTDRVAEFPQLPDYETFDCVGRIHLALRFEPDDYGIRNSPMKVRWINPAGDVELETDKARYVESNSSAYRWSTMILKRPQGGGLFSFLDQSAGMERFIGEWRAQVFLGDDQLPTQSLTIEC